MQVCWSCFVYCASSIAEICSSAVLLCGGLAAFTLGQASVSPAFHVIGVGLISVSALSEAAVGNIQENVLGKYRCVMLEIVFWSNLFSALIVLCYLVVSAELIDR